jgi:glycine cleavage system H lipoate-binding protein
VCRINPVLAECPEAIQHDPYGEGWLACVRPARWFEERDLLVWHDRLQTEAQRRIQREPDDNEVVR